MPNVAKCADDIQVSELLQKCFVRIKTGKKKLQQSVTKTEQKTEKITITIMKKERLIRC